MFYPTYKQILSHVSIIETIKVKLLKLNL